MIEAICSVICAGPTATPTPGVFVVYTPIDCLGSWAMILEGLFILPVLIRLAGPAK